MRVSFLVCAQMYSIAPGLSLGVRIAMFVIDIRGVPPQGSSGREVLSREAPGREVLGRGIFLRGSLLAGKLCISTSNDLGREVLGTEIGRVPRRVARRAEEKRRSGSEHGTALCEELIRLARD